MESWHQLPAEEDPSQCLEQTSALHEISYQHGITLNPEQISIEGDSRMQREADRSESLQLEFQDSRLSPALTLIPQGKPLVLSESTLLHQTDSEFVPLRGVPDLSIVSERYHHLSNLDVESSAPNKTHEQASLSQHPLSVSAASSEGGSSCCSLSQHSLSPGSHYQATHIDEDEVQESRLKDNNERKLGREEQTNADLDTGVTTACAAGGGAPAHLLVDVLEKDLSVASLCSNVVTSASETALSQATAVLNQQHLIQNQSKHTDIGCYQSSGYSSEDRTKFRPSGSREQPQGGSSSLLSHRKTTRKGGVSLSSHISMTSNITVRSSSMQPHCNTDPSVSENAKSQSGNKNASCVTPASGIGVYVPGLHRVLWASGSQTAADGSFLSSQPVSQSTPAVPPSREAPAVTTLSPIFSHQNTSDTLDMSIQTSNSKGDKMPALHLITTEPQTIVGTPDPPSSVPVQAHTEPHVLPLHQQVSDTHDAPSAGLHVSAFTTKETSVYPLNLDARSSLSEQDFKVQDSTLSAGRVRSLPTLSYLQKVDAWKANQSSSGSFYDNLALRGVDYVKRKVLNSVSNGQSLHRNNETTSEHDTNTCAQASQPGVAASSQPKSRSPRHGDMFGPRKGGAPHSESPLAHSHSSISTVVTSIQQDWPQQNPPLPLVSSDGISLYRRESSLLSGRASEHNQADQPTLTDPLKPSAELSLGQFSDVSSNHNIDNALSSSQGSCHGDQSLLASVGVASSAMSLEVDNYAPYFISRPGSPPPSFELNIEDRIPLYLHNLGIDQSPSTILNPFTTRGPIREPEFSPTDLCTIKGSVGTPTKSTQPSEGGSPQKDIFSSSSLLSANSSASLPWQLAIQKPDRPPSPGSVRLVRCQASETASDPFTSPPDSAPQETDAPQREGSYGLPAQLTSDSVLHPGTLLEAKKGDSSLVGSDTLLEIRRLLGHAECLVSGHSSLDSSPGSQFYSESDASFLSLRQNTQAYRDDSSLSVGGKISLVLARSSSDSALKDTSSSCGPLQLSTHGDHLEATIPSQNGDENLKSRDLHVAPMRTEPEGCSAADPDKVGPVSLPVIQGNVPSATDDQQQSQESAENPVVSSPENSQSHSPEEVELGVLSDSSSDSSLAARVAQLLQSESSVSVVTSRPSTTDPEESRAREWIMMKLSGRQCESLELNVEDRKRIEEIKRELLLHTKQPKWSSDSEGSAQSSVGAVPEPTIDFAAVHSAEDRLSEQLQRVAQNPMDSFAPLHTPLSHNLEARVCQKSDERLNLPATLTSITVASTRRTPSPHTESWHLTSQLDHTQAAPQPQGSHSPKCTSLKNTIEEIRQTLKSERGTEIEEKVTTKTGKERKEEESVQSVVQDPTLKNLSDKNDNAPSMDSPSQKAHMSHIHLTLPPKPHQSMSQILQSPVDDAHGPSKMQSCFDKPPSDQALLSISCSSEEQHTSVTSESRAAEDRHAGQGQNTARVCDYSQIRYRHSQAFIPPERLPVSSRPLSFHTAAVPTLLPYKPHGSSELFYMPQTDPRLSPVHSSQESSHPGSDDAVPPRFTAEILGSRELEDKEVRPKHKEGIYSKRAKMNRGLHDSKITSSTQKYSAGFHCQSSASRISDGSHLDQEAKCHSEQAEQDEEEFVPLNLEADYSKDDLHHQNHTAQRYSLEPVTLRVPIKADQEEEHEKGIETRELGLEVSSSLDQLWQRFNARWRLQEMRPTNEGEMSLLERLERLSRLLNSTTPANTPAKQVYGQEEGGKSRTREQELKRAKGKETRRRGESSGRSEVRVSPKTAWMENPVQANQTLEEEEQENAHRCPAERDESASVSLETSSSQSTIDTQRLLRAFGPQRVNSEATGAHIKKSSSSLLKLYNTINKQKTGHEHNIAENCLKSAATELISGDESTASAESLSSPSTYTLPSKRGMPRTLSTKKRKVKLVSRGIQAGDLEIVVNGTRRHTRDVGTIFPSPCNARDTRAPPSTHAELQANIATVTACSAVPVRSKSMPRREALHKSNQTCYPNGVSWFVCADKLKQDARKENEPHSEAAHSAWFEPYSRILPRREPPREPLRERYIQLEQEKPLEPKAPPETDGRKPALVCLSLQEALELHRPDFVSRSRERMKRLCFLAEERKMQAVFNREREELFNRPLPLQQPIAAQPPLPSKRVIPVKEMVQRSKRGVEEKAHTQRIDKTDRVKRIYAQLPEVQKRKQEEKRKAQYNTYRLNAQLFNKKVTNRVLGRRVPWQ